jgi:hypothetical protein
MFSPNPGHKNDPELSFRNQFTYKIRRQNIIDIFGESNYGKCKIDYNKKQTAIYIPHIFSAFLHWCVVLACLSNAANSVQNCNRKTDALQTGRALLLCLLK